MKNDLLKKLIVVFLSALILSTEALSFYYISAEAFHTHQCKDNRCPVCKVIELSESLVKGSASLAFAAAAAAVLAFAALAFSMRKEVSRAAENLITMKVRLNN